MDGLWMEARGRQKQSNDPGNNQHNPQYANYWAPPTRKRHSPPHPAQPQHTNDGAPRTRKRHQQEHQPQRPTESSDPTQHAKGRTGDCPGPCKETTTQRNVTQGGGIRGHQKVWRPQSGRQFRVPLINYGRIRTSFMALGCVPPLIPRLRWSPGPLGPPCARPPLPHPRVRCAPPNPHYTACLLARQTV